MLKEPDIDAVAMIKPELYICQGCSRDKVIAVDSYDEVYELIKTGKVDVGMGILEDISYGVSDALHEVLTNNKLYIYRCNIVNENGHNKKVVTFADHLIVEENHNRLKVMFVCKNKSGSLSSILSMISDYGVNLTEIHSAPNRQEHWNYRFYVELSANLLKKDIQALVFQLMNETEEFTDFRRRGCPRALLDHRELVEEYVQSEHQTRQGRKGRHHRVGLWLLLLPHRLPVPDEYFAG